MPNIDFPNSPTVNQQFTSGGKIWQWSGTTWDVVRIAVPAASLTSTDVSRLTGATSNLQTQINTLSTNLGNTLDDYVPIGDVGVADGVASLDATGKIPIAQLGNLIDGAPAALDTLNELAAAINDDASYAAGITTTLGTKISNAGGDIITSSLASTIPLRIRGAASQTANLQEWQNSAGTVLAKVNSDGTANFVNGSITLGQYGNINASAIFTSFPSVFYSGHDGGIPVTAKASYSSQTADIQQWQNSAGTALAKVTKDGDVFSGGLISNGMTSGYAGADNVLNNLGIQASSFGLSYFRVKSGSAGAIVALIDGATSQTGDLTQWRNSAGTILAKITASGALDATAITVNGAALNTLPSQTGNSGKYLTTDGNNASWGIISFDTTSIEIGTIMGAY